MKHIELYLETELERERARKKRAGIAMIAVAAAGLLACVLFCVFTKRKNLTVMLPLTVCTSILAGWIVIFLSHTAYGDAKAAIRHREMLAEGERELFCGRIEKTDEVYRVRKGIRVRKVRVKSEERETTLMISEALSGRLPDAFDGEVEASYDFVVAYGVNGDD